MTVINNENATETGAIATDLNTNINDIRTYAPSTLNSSPDGLSVYISEE